MVRGEETEMVPAYREICFFVTFSGFDRLNLYKKGQVIFLPKNRHPGLEQVLGSDDKNNDENYNTGARARDPGLVTFGNTSEALRG
jgi:hypothetical protein